MPITIEYQPSLVAGGQIAYQAGRGRFLQEQDRFNFQQAGLAEQQRQFDQRLQFAAQEAALRDQQLRSQLGQQAGLAQQQLAYRDLADRRGIAANFQMAEMQQEGWDRRNQQQLQLAQMQEAAAQARLKQTQQFNNAMQEKDTLQKYITENSAVLSPEQAQGLVAQWEQSHGLPWGFDTTAIIEAQQAQEQRMAAELEEVAGMLGMPPNSIGKLIDWIPDKNGKPIISPTPLGEAWLKQQEQEKELAEDQRRVDTTLDNAKAIKQMEIDSQFQLEQLKAQVEAAKAQGQAPGEAAKQQVLDFKTVEAARGAAVSASNNIRTLESEWEQWNKTPETVRRAEQMEQPDPIPPPDQITTKAIPPAMAQHMPIGSLFRLEGDMQFRLFYRRPNGKFVLYTGKQSLADLDKAADANYIPGR